MQPKIADKTDCRPKSRTPGMHFNPVTLNFIGPHKTLEKKFVSFSYENSIRQVRFSIMAALVLCIVYGVFDYWSGAARNNIIWAARFLVMIPFALVMIGCSFCPWFKRWMQPLLCLGVFAFGSSIVAMITVSPPNLRFAYLAGFVQVIFYSCTLLRMRFVWVSAVSWLLVAFYAAMDIWFIKSEPSLLLANLFCLAGTVVMGMMASYAIEYYTRREYFLLNELGLKSKQLEAVNQDLGKRVEQRTLALARLNKSLQNQIRKQENTEKALVKSRERYRQIVDNVTDYICVHTLEGLILEVNQVFRSKLGYGLNEDGGLRLNDFVNPQYHEYLRQYLEELKRSHKSRGLLTLITRKGEKRLVEYSSQVARDENDQLVVFGSGRDITENWRTNRELKESQVQFKSIFESTPAGIAIIDPDENKITNINPAAARLIGLDPEKLVGQPFNQFLAEKQGESSSDSGQRREAILKNKDGIRIPVLKNEHAFSLAGKPHIAVSFIDITIIKSAEAAKRQAKLKLAQAQNLQALGTLAGGIAHDFNNILYGMIGFAELALDDALPGSVQEENLHEILAGGQRAKDLIAQILAFSRQSKVEKKPVNLVPLFKEIIKLIRASLPTTISIETKIDSNLDMVMANPSQIHQVLLNLCTNAGHAMEDKGGNLRLVLANICIANSMVTSHGILSAGRYVLLAVSDNGCGMPAEVARRIFEPFFTTKQQGRGTGMGLAVVHGIVKSHGGVIDVQSEAGRGTTFNIYLPAIAAQKTGENANQRQFPVGRERILFVDDEKPIRVMVSKTLSKLGYTVKTCNNGLEAWKTLEQTPYLFDLVISDLTMPQMTGMELALKIRRLRKEIPIILCTGYNSEYNIRQAAEFSISEILYKPIDRFHLARAIRKALDKVNKKLPAPNQMRA